jgi:cytochrome c
MEFAPSGDMYILEYGTRWFQGNDDARLVRIEYNAGNRKPIVAAAVDKPSGALPMRVKLSSAGTLDLDEDSLRYVWTIARKGDGTVARLTQPNPSYTFTRPGTYTATLTATDVHGASSTANVEVVAGNEPPNVDVTLVNSNKSFFFPGVPVRYTTTVTDREDGSLRGGTIPSSRVHLSAQYLKAGLPAAGAGGASGENALTRGRRLIEANDCLSCHQFNVKAVGPAYVDVAKKYHGDNSAVAHLVKKIREGGSGVWGTATMPAHPNLTEAQTSSIVTYILSLADRANAETMPVRGSYTPPTGSEMSPQGVVVLRAEYTDRGGNAMPSITGEKSIVLRSPTVVVADEDVGDGASKQSVEGMPVTLTIVNKSGASVAVKQIDLTGISAVTFSAVAPTQYQAKGGKIEVHLDSPTGALLGESEVIHPTSTPAPVTLRTVLRPTTGIHDLYFVFTNPDVKDGFLFAVTTATFEPRR